MSGRLRAITAAILLFAGALAVVLSSAPQLHEWLHNIGDPATHQCAATLISAGGVEHSDCHALRTSPQDAPAVQTLRAEPVLRLLAALDFSLLEHAPPSRS